jgi:hypothetical protein
MKMQLDHDLLPPMPIDLSLTVYVTINRLTKYYRSWVCADPVTRLPAPYYLILSYALTLFDIIFGCLYIARSLKLHSWIRNKSF